MVTPEKLKCSINPQVCFFLLFIHSFGECINQQDLILPSNDAVEGINLGVQLSSEESEIPKIEVPIKKRSHFFVSAKPDNSKCWNRCSLSEKFPRSQRSLKLASPLDLTSQFSHSDFVLPVYSSLETINEKKRQNVPIHNPEKRTCSECTPKACLPPCKKPGCCDPKCQNTCPPLMNTPCPCPCPPKPCCPQAGQDNKEIVSLLVNSTGFKAVSAENVNSVSKNNFLDKTNLNEVKLPSTNNDKGLARVAKQCNCDCACAVTTKCTTACMTCRPSCKTPKKDLCAPKCPPTLPTCRPTCCPTTEKTTCPTTTCPPKCPGKPPPCPKVHEPVWDNIQQSVENLYVPSDGTEPIPAASAKSDSLVSRNTQASEANNDVSDNLQLSDREKKSCPPLCCSKPTCATIKPPCPQPCPPKCATCCPTTCWAELPKPEKKRQCDDNCPCPWPCPCGTPGPCGKLDRCPGPYPKLPGSCPKACPPKPCSTPCPTTCPPSVTTTCDPNCPTCKQYHKCKIGKRQDGEPKVATCPKTCPPPKCPTPCPCRPKPVGTTCQYPCKITCDQVRFVREQKKTTAQNDCFTTPACPCPSKCSTCPTTRGPTKCPTCPTPCKTCSPPNTCSTCRMRPCCPCSTYAVKRCVGPATEGSPGISLNVREGQDLLAYVDSSPSIAINTTAGKSDSLANRDFLAKSKFDKFEKYFGDKNKPVLNEISELVSVNSQPINENSPESKEIDGSKKNVRQCCTTKCTTPCTTKCTTACTTKCQKQCTTKCPKQCTTKCPKQCTTKCPKPCTTKCPKPCTTKCTKPCTTKCTTPCTTKCTTTCATKCTTPCDKREAKFYKNELPEEPKLLAPDEFRQNLPKDVKLWLKRCCGATTQGCTTKGCTTQGCTTQGCTTQGCTTKACTTKKATCGTPCPAAKCADPCPTTGCPPPKPPKCCPGFKEEFKGPEQSAIKAFKRGCCAPPGPAHCQVSTTKKCGTTPSRCPTTLKCPDSPTCTTACGATTKGCGSTTESCSFAEEKTLEKRSNSVLPESLFSNSVSHVSTKVKTSNPIENLKESSRYSPLLLPPPVQKIRQETVKRACEIDKYAPTPCCVHTTTTCPPKQTGEKQWSKRYVVSTESIPVDRIAGSEESEKGFIESKVKMCTTACTTKDPCATTKDPCATTKDPCATTKDPCATTKDPCATTEDPCATTKDPCATTKDPCATTEDPCATTKDPCASTCGKRAISDQDVSLYVQLKDEVEPDEKTNSDQVQYRHFMFPSRTLEKDNLPLNIRKSVNAI